jgi:hypothetical protein
MTTDFQSEAERDTAMRDEVRRLNSDGLSKLQAEYGTIYIPWREYAKWRPTQPTSGLIDGLEHLGELTCLCTDGLQAWFERQNGDVFLGHVGNFRWSEPVISYVPYVDDHGRERFFKSIKDSGAPSTLYRLLARPKTPREKKARKKKPGLLASALELLSRNVMKI